MPVRILRWVLLAAMAGAGLQVLAVLVTGGYECRILGVLLDAENVGPPAIVLLILTLVHGFVRRDGFSRGAPQRGMTLFAMFLAIYLANGETHATGDTLPARYLPFSIYRSGNFDLDEFPFLHRDYAVEFVNGHYVSGYPVAPALLALPIYLPSALGRVRPESDFPRQLEKLSAAVIVALSGALFYLLLRSLTSERLALVLTLTYALGTSSLSVSSQAMWQHGASQLAVVAALYGLVRGRTESRWILLSGFALAFAVACRPSNLLLAVPLGAYVAVYHTRSTLPFVLSGLPPLVFQLWYNVTYFGQAFRTQFPLAAPALWSTPVGDGLFGLLLSPARGLFVYSPVFLLSVVGLLLARRRDGDALLRYLSVGTLAIILVYSRWTMWWGGHSYGPRLLADLTPGLTLLLLPLARACWRSRSFRLLFGGLLLWSIGAHALGAFWDEGRRWNAYPNVDRFPTRLWSWGDSPLVDGAAEVWNRVVIAGRRLPTSHSSPELLAASLSISGFGRSAPTVVNIEAKPIEFSLEAVNVGDAVWLSREPGGRVGRVMLGWRWVRPHEGAGDFEGFEMLRYDVFPGKPYEFVLSLDLPRKPGAHRLEVGLVAETPGRLHSFGALSIVSVE